MKNYIYDIETFPNIFTLAIKHHITGTRWLFEISDRRNDYHAMIDFLVNLKRTGGRMVGYNNIGFDYPVLHYMIEQGPGVTNAQIMTKVSKIIDAPRDQLFAHMIWDNDRHVDQIDLFKIHHFDNLAKSTSLKMLEFNMRSETIEELPFTPGTVLTHAEFDTIIAYNHKDVDETHLFYKETIPKIEFREYLSEKYDRNFLNHNDTKIGKDFFIMEIEKKQPGTCYHRVNGKREPRQTPRPSIAIKDVIFDYVKFETPEFNRVLDWLNAQTITETKGVFDGLNATLSGFQFDFGTGGIHGSISASRVDTNATHTLVDVDVTSYYPSLAIANRLYPAHLGDIFCDIYQNVKEQRMSYAKGTAENLMLKLALNGVYGDSNNKYSPFYDPAYTMGITINGQLLLCMLAEQVLKIPGLVMIQINTDGMTVHCPHEHLNHFRGLCGWWERLTHLDLEEAVYQTMWIKDVNNYIAQYNTGKLKRKGAYEYDVDWYQNHSALVVKKVAVAAMVYGSDVAAMLRQWPEPMDFMLRTKVTGKSRLVLVDAFGAEVVGQKITRYYVSTVGKSLVKIMPPLAKNPDKWRRIGINVGRVVTECNDVGGLNMTDVDYDFYESEINKLLIA